MLKAPEQKPPSRWNWLLWWRVDQDDVEWQAAHYSELGFFHGFKGWSGLALLLSSALTIALILFTGNSRNFFDVAVMVVLAGFIFFGHRWAMVGAMLWWTLEKVVQMIGNPGTIILALVWWGLYMHLFYMAFLVERRRRQPRIDPDAFD